VIRRFSRWVDDRFAAARFLNGALNRIFPDHWSFIIGEIVLFCFIVLVVTGTYLTFFFEPSSREVVYNGTYVPLRGVEMSAAYRSALDISFEVRAGLVMRQIHHWASLIFMASMVVHLMRVFFTGAFRRPRELNWVVGVTLLVLSIFNGFLGYSLLDDLLSGTGLRVGYSISLSIPVVGPQLTYLIFGGEFPAPSIIPRFYTLHVLVLPAIITALLLAHLAIVWRQKHTQFAGKGRTETNIVGSRLWPAYATKSVGLFLLTSSLLCVLGGLAQINPIWIYGPFRTALAAAAVTSASQPDWYMGWLDGALRLFPGWELRAFGFTIANPFFPGAVLPGVTFAGMYAWPFLEARFGRDRQVHHLLDRPRDAPLRTAIGVSVFAFYAILFLAAGNDVLAAVFEVAPETITALFRVLLFALPVALFLITRRVCRELQGRRPPATGVSAGRVIRTAEGRYEVMTETAASRSRTAPPVE
jgi:ubiquinol-cytochrome c reductase cytochrome b subunit